MKTSLLSAEALAAFQARGGKIVRVEQGAGVGLTDRQWYAASQGNLNVNRLLGNKTDNELIEERHVSGNIVRNGLGELIGEI